MTDVHQEGEGQDPTLQQGTESVEELEKAIAELFPDDTAADAKQAFLDQVNKIEGRQYKTIEDYTKSRIEQNKIVNRITSEEGRKKKEEEEKAKAEKDKTSTPQDRYAEELMAIKLPNSKFVIDELRQVAKDLKVDIFVAWDKSAWLQKEADVRAAAEVEKNKNEGRIKKPSQKISGGGGGGNEPELTEAERRILSRRPGLMEKYKKEQENK